MLFWQKFIWTAKDFPRNYSITTLDAQIFMYPTGDHLPDWLPNLLIVRFFLSHLPGVDSRWYKKRAILVNSNICTNKTFLLYLFMTLGILIGNAQWCYPGMTFLHCLMKDNFSEIKIKYKIITYQMVRSALKFTLGILLVVPYGFLGKKTLRCDKIF